MNCFVCGVVASLVTIAAIAGFWWLFMKLLSGKNGSIR